MAVLMGEGFTLELNIVKQDGYVDVNVFVSSDDYSGKICIDCSRQEVKSFVKSLSTMYEKLKEDATGISDYEQDNYLVFRSDDLGHFKIEGRFTDYMFWSLKFERSTDQTYIKPFLSQLKNETKSI